MLKSKIKDLIKAQRYRQRKFNDELSPVFILGINRSGTSMFSSLFSQHPQLEGLFAGSSDVHISKDTGHSEGFCESNHIWDWLISKEHFGTDAVEDYFLWGHPKHISRYYRDSSNSNKEKNLLINAVDFHRKTNQIPLIKDQFNSLRIPLIKELFPKAKFVLVIREPENYVPSCLHKWTKNKKIKGRFPAIGLHWLSFYQTVFHDLKRFALNDYVILDYSLLYSPPEILTEVLNKAFLKLGIEAFTPDLSGIKKDARFINQELKGIQEKFESVDKVLSIEDEFFFENEQEPM